MTSRTVRVLILFTLAIIIFPLASLFTFKTIIFEGVLGYQDGSIGGAVAAVVAVHVVIGVYVYVAWKEDVTTEAEQQKLK